MLSVCGRKGKGAAWKERWICCVSEREGRNAGCVLKAESAPKAWDTCCGSSLGARRAEEVSHVNGSGAGGVGTGQGE